MPPVGTAPVQIDGPAGLAGGEAEAELVAAGDSEDRAAGPEPAEPAQAFARRRTAVRVMKVRMREPKVTAPDPDASPAPCRSRPLNTLQY